MKRKVRLRALLPAAVLAAILFTGAGCGKRVPAEPAPDEIPEAAAAEAQSRPPETVNTETEEETMAETQDKSWPRAKEQPFNRLSVRYSSEGPVKLTVSYTVLGKEKTDVFFLEAGEDAVFSGLIEPYLKG